MPPQPSYPGAYIEESQRSPHDRWRLDVEHSVHRPHALGPGERGDDRLRVQCAHEEVRRSLVAELAGHAVRDLYLNGGKRAVIVRLTNGATAASLDR
jgi:hypothetical protein